ncbi:MAG: hypothetical protein KDD53_13025, partial [Bdellovibrionales bacterium]|nr:hypothetical protein [Bdellovibrionales bacterium]
MAVVINSNVSALAAIRQLDKATSDLGGSLERLSSGMRINKASDDAAGLAVSENLKVDAAVANRGRLNVNDGISILQIADSALDQISDMLARKAELAEQASNGSFTQAQREALDLEYQALDKEIKRIVDTTEFNGLKILGGSLNEEATFEQLTNTTGGTTNGGTTYVATSADGLIVTYYDDSQGALVQLNTITNESTIITTEIGVNNKIVSDSGGQTIVFESTGDIT